MNLTHKRSYCTSREAAEMLKVSVKTIQSWVDQGVLEAWKTLGGHRRIKLSSVERLRAAGDEKLRDVVDLGGVIPKFKLLIVEDDGALIRLYKKRIQSWNFFIDVITAENGWNALLIIGKEAPDLMITDLKMPTMDGFQMIRALSATPIIDGMEIIAVTSMSQDEIYAQGGLPETVKILFKPLSFENLKTLVRESLLKQLLLSKLN